MAGEFSGCQLPDGPLPTGLLPGGWDILLGMRQAAGTDRAATPVASFALLCEPPEGRLRWLAVDPRHQRCGFGQEALHVAEQMAFRRGCQYLEAETLATWEGACKLYVQAGYGLT